MWQASVARCRIFNLPLSPHRAMVFEAVADELTSGSLTTESINSLT
jgi:hypothetical protein